MTSLAEQLKRLAIPNVLQQKELKKRASLLFDESEAANLDRDSVYDIGLKGLKELGAIDPIFLQFTDNLFSVNSRLFERTTQSKEANEKLDQTIRKFLRLLSPYALVRSAHKALEWLICRYHIQDFNTNDLMALVLPYHESRIFAKVLQLVNLNLPTSRNFVWLNPIKKEGIHLSKLVLINHLISDSSFLRFVCDTFLNILKELESHKGVKKLSTLINFYCTTLIGALTRKEFKDHHLTVILPSLMSALSNESINIRVVAYMICGQLVASHKVAPLLLKEIVHRVINDDSGKDDVRFQKTRALLLVLIFQKQSSAKIPEDCEDKLKPLKEILIQLSENGIHLKPLVENMKAAGMGLVFEDAENVQPPSDLVGPDMEMDLQYFQELKDCHGDKKERAWVKLRSRLIERVNIDEMFKALCKIAPSYDKLVLLLCLIKILKGPKRDQIVSNILKSNFGKSNPYIQELSSSLQGKKTVQEVIEAFIMKQNREFDNPVEFEAWLVALKELKTYSQFSDNYAIWQLGLKILLASLPLEYNPTQALQILQFLKILNKRKLKVRAHVLDTLINYIRRQPSYVSEWYDLSTKNPDIWLKVALLEAIFEGLYKDADNKNRYFEILDKFRDLSFPRKENFISFMSAVCAGSPYENPESSEYKISPFLQIFSLNAIWMQLRANNQAAFEVFYTESDRALCYMLICLSSPVFAVRKATYEVIKSLTGLLEMQKNLEGTLFYKELLLRSEEILADHEQLSVAMYYLLSPRKSVQAILDPSFLQVFTEMRRTLFKIVVSEGTPFYVSAKILSILEAVNSEEILMGLTGLCSRAIILSKDSRISRIILSNFWARINEDTAEVLEKYEVWDLVVRCLKHPKCEDSNPAVSFLNSVTKEVFEKLTNAKKFQLLELLISVRSETDCNEISSAIASAVKKINIDSKLILPLITKMTAVSISPQRLRDERRTVAGIIESKNWKTGISLLELIQSKKKLYNSDLLLKPLFGVLQFCFTQEEQTAFEYAKQLVLGCLLHCCQKLSANAQNVDGSFLNADLVVQCLRASPNPQTHHHALLLLSCLAGLVPDQVMHNIMAIFTFMGTSVTRLDDEHSVKIVTQVVDAVVPVLMESMKTESQNIQKVMAKILVVFVWALKDIPQHRRKPLFLQLLTTLQPDRSLWILLLILIENYVLQGNLTKTEGLPPNLFLGLQLTLSMTPQVILESVLKIVYYISSIRPETLNKETVTGRSPKKFGSQVLKKSENLYETEIKSSKQLRQFVYTILTFLNNLLSNNSFIVQITEENKDEKSLEFAFKETMALLMGYIQSAMHQYGAEHDKFWKAVIHQCYEMLDKFVSLVPSEMLLSVIKQLLHQSMGPLRKKTLDLFNALLQNHRGEFTESQKKLLLQLLESILEIIQEIGDNDEQEREVLQQTALISLKFLTKLLSQENLKLFKKILGQLCDIAKKKKCSGHLLGSVIIAVSDQVAYLKVHSVSHLPVFLPLMLKIFSNNMHNERSGDLGLISVTTALYRVVDVLPHFLSPYLHTILYNVCVASVSAPDNSDLSKKLLLIRQKIANNVEPRVLIPSIATCYDKIISKCKFDAAGPLLNILSTNYSSINSSDIVKLLVDLSKFFFNALNFRSSAELSESEVTLADIDKVESFVIEAMVQLVLKLSESSFRPLYYQLSHWVSEHPDRNISFFRLSCRLAESLKGLFVLFAGHFLHNAANLLDAVNSAKTKTSYFGDGEEDETKSIILLESILKTLHLVFLYDSADTSNFLNKDKFEVLLHPLVDQLENSLGGMDSLEERTKKLLTPCLAQMALATDDTLWKSLNYQILVKTKSNLPQVRIGALETIVAMASKLGEDYLTLLPETIGSLAELLEDEDDRVENATKKAIQQLEQVLGQPIREYFQQ